MTRKQLVQMLEQYPEDLQVGTWAEVPDTGGGHEYREIVGALHVRTELHGKPGIQFLRLVLWGDPDSKVW